MKKMKKDLLTVKMSIDANGSLAGATLISSSGYADLDEGALIVFHSGRAVRTITGNL